MSDNYNPVEPSDYTNTKIIVETNPDDFDNPLVTIYPSQRCAGTRMKYEAWLSESTKTYLYPHSLTKEIEQAVGDHYRKRQEKVKDKKILTKSIPAKTFQNGDMVQSCYEPMNGESFFMHWIAAEQQAEKIPQIIDPVSGVKLLPLRDKNVTSGLLLLPSGV